MYLQEAEDVRRMARIRACNMAAQFAINPVVAFATFAVYRYELSGGLCFHSSLRR